MTRWMLASAAAAVGLVAAGAAAELHAAGIPDAPDQLKVGDTVHLVPADDGGVILRPVTPAGRGAVGVGGLGRTPQTCDDPAGSIAGTVFNPNGAAVEGAVVLVMKRIEMRGSAAGGRRVVARTRTDEDGDYLVEELCGGTYYVSASSHTAAGDVWAGFHDADADGAPDPVQVTSNAPAVAGVDVHLHPVDAAPPTHPPVCRGGRGSISGLVTDEAGDPVPGARVMAAMATSSGGVVEFGAATGRDGRYEILRLCDGAYEVRAMSVDTAGVTSKGVYDPDGDGAPDRVALGDDGREASGIDIALHPVPHPGSCDAPQGSIEGRVFASNTGTPGAAVHLVWVEDKNSTGVIRGVVVARTTTDDDGAYGFDDVCDGHYIVTAEAATAAGRLHGFHDADGDGTPDIVAIGPDGRDAGGIDVLLVPHRPSPAPPPPAPCRDGENALAGVVTLGDAPTAGAKVMVLSARPNSGSGLGGELVATTETDDQGAYRVEQLCDGAFLVVANAHLADGTTVRGFYDPEADGAPTPVRLGPDRRSAEGVDVTLSAVGCRDGQGALGGTVTDVGGSAVEGARVTVVGEHDTWTVNSSPGGQYRLGGLCPGRYVVVALHGAGEALQVGFHDPDGDGTPDPVVLTPDQPTAAGVDIALAPVTLVAPLLSSPVPVVQ